MSLHHSFAAALWLVAGVGAYELAESWMDAAQSGKIHPWTLVALFWAVALASVAIHHLSRFLSDCLAEGAEAATRYAAQLKPYVGPHIRALSDHPAQAARALKHYWFQHRPAIHAASEVLKRHWAQHRAAAVGQPQAVPAAGRPSPTFAAKLGVLIGVR